MIFSTVFTKIWFDLTTAVYICREGGEDMRIPYIATICDAKTILTLSYLAAHPNQRKHAKMFSFGKRLDIIYLNIIFLL